MGSTSATKTTGTRATKTTGVLTSDNNTTIRSLLPPQQLLEFY